MNDFRYALRTLRNSPGFTLTVTLLLALGIGASCVIFGALDAVMLKRLPVRHPEQLFRVVTNRPQLGKRSDMTRALFQAFRERATCATDVFGFQEEFAGVTEPGPAEQIRVHLVTPNYFSALGTGAAIGRVLAPDDVDRAVLSYGFFEQRFNADRNAIGRSIVIHGHRYTVVGVMPRDFNGISVDSAPQVRVPLVSLPQFADANTPPGDDAIELDVSLRLRAGVPVAKASGEINSIWQSVESKGMVEAVKRVELDPLEHGVSRLRDRFSGALLFLTSAVGLLLLIVCANVAGLLLARSASRRQEISVRLALGATRMRLVRQMLTETLLLAVIGGAGGVMIAFFAMPLLEGALPPMRDFSSETVPLALHLKLDFRVLAFSLLLCLATAMLFGLAPALQASRADVIGALRSARATSSWRGRQALMIFEVALCTVLLAGAGLLVRTFEHLQHLDAGFDRDHVVTFTVNPRLIGYSPEQADAVGKSWIEKVRALPGVTSVAHATLGVMRGSGMKMTIAITGQPITSADFLNTSTNSVSAEYFETMGMRIVEGRGFAETDRFVKREGQRRKVIVNQTFARQFFHGESAIGQTVGNGGDSNYHSEIVGVVSDAKYRSLREPIPATMYYFGSEFNDNRFILHVRTANRPESIINPVREALRSIDSQVPIVEIHTLAEEVSASLSTERLVATLATVFGAIAALLTAVGLYGLLAYNVAQRRREIGIRIALGARASDISGTIGGQAFVMIAGGLSAGIGTTLLAAPAIRSLLYGIPPSDRITLLLTAVFVLLVGVIATAIPVLRALRVDPAIALRQE
jgi:predicted permease